MDGFCATWQYLFSSTFCTLKIMNCPRCNVLYWYLVQDHSGIDGKKTWCAMLIPGTTLRYSQRRGPMRPYSPTVLVPGRYRAQGPLQPQGPKCTRALYAFSLKLRRAYLVPYQVGPYPQSKVMGVLFCGQNVTPSGQQRRSHVLNELVGPALDDCCIICHPSQFFFLFLLLFLFSCLLRKNSLFQAFIAVFSCASHVDCYFCFENDRTG